jgi:dolichol-phosphate mannosyltransferase
MKNSLDESPKVSLIVPAHNEEENLGALVRALSKCLSNAGVSYEIVIVDDNSTDDTGEIAEKVSTVFQNVKVYVKQRRF